MRMNRGGRLMLSAPSAVKSLTWYRELDRGHWRVLEASFLGWIFDGYETYSLLLVLGPALRQLLEPARIADLSRYAGFIAATTLFGWAAGGVLCGIVAGSIARQRTMLISVLLYAVFNGLSAL